MDLETTVPCTTSGPALAREAVRINLPSHVLPDVRQDAQLLTSEIVTNAVRHSGATKTDLIGLRLETTDERVLVEVEDVGEGFDKPQALPAPEVGGYGLHLVNAIAQQWGVREGVRPPTVVWFELLVQVAEVNRID
jgi:anti-sigma regulatory factor (Ser/Thr protein kinase)